MRRVFSIVVALALVMPIAAWAQSKPDFSGTWTVNAEKSDPPPGGGGGRGPGGPITIKQTATELSITSQGRQGSQTLTYKLDGTESTNPGRGGMEEKSKAKWDGSTLVVETTQDMNGTPMTSTVKRRLDNDGKDMIVETSMTGMPNGPTTRKVVYTKGS
jgi:hypothetical protein